MASAQKGASTTIREIGIVVASILLVLISLEIILRLFFPVYLAGYIGAYQYDKELGYRLKDDLHMLKTSDYQQEILTNKLGTVNLQDNFNGYRMLIFVLGDSFTQGTGLASDASYPFQLDLLLNMENDRYVKNYAVVNLGLAAFGGEQNLLALQRYAKKIGKPNFILYLGCSNDYDDDLLFKSGYRHKHLVDGSPYWGWYLHPLMWFSNETELGKRLKIGLGRLQHARIFATNATRKKSLTSDHGKMNVASLEEPIFNNLIKLSQDYGAKLIISWTDDSLDESYQWLKKYAEKNHIAFADWYPAVESVRKGIPGAPLDNPHSGGHYRTWVNGQIAKAYARQILALQKNSQSTN
jgi:lysophospholipase L1-like esterase